MAESPNQAPDAAESQVVATSNGSQCVDEKPLMLEQPLIKVTEAKVPGKHDILPAISNGFHLNGEIERDPLYEDFDAEIGSVAAPESTQECSEEELRRQKEESDVIQRRSSGRIREKVERLKAEEEKKTTSFNNGISPRKLHKKFGKFKSSPDIADEVHNDESTPGNNQQTSEIGSLPIKVKARWRRSCEQQDSNQLAMEPRVDLTMLRIHDTTTKFTVDGKDNLISSANGLDTTPDSMEFSLELKGVKREAVSKQEETLNSLEETKEEIRKRLSSFEHIAENKFICERRFNKQNRGMECDCSLTKDEMRRGIKGCGEDCLNRLLMIECDKSCSLGKLCGNKRFQNIENSPCEVFKTSWKGIGLRATADIDADTFLMEYVGEVLDLPRFRKRAKKYSKNDVQHFYFMAVSSELFIDASNRGSISRFINHSCDPNAETQKWTVDGELRVGFFSKRNIKKGEEVTFDYKYERYGQHAQQCYCGSDNCRGWLGGDPDRDREDTDPVGEEDEEDDFWSSEEEELPTAPKTKITSSTSSSEKSTPKQKKISAKRKVRKSPRKVKNFEDDLEEEIERFKTTGIRTKVHTVELCRLMMRTSDYDTRMTLANLLLAAEKTCRRLFLDYHGMKILHGWMSELKWTSNDLNLKLKLENVLGVLNIPHKTMLVDSKVWTTVTLWSTDSYNTAEALEKPEISSSTEVDRKDDIVKKEEPVLPDTEAESRKIAETLSSQNVANSNEDSRDSAAEVQPITKAEGLNETSEMTDKVQQIKTKALELLDSWKMLEEVFKIPRKALREEHEREAMEAEEAAATQQRKLCYERSRPKDIVHVRPPSSFLPPKPDNKLRFSRFDDITGELKRSDLPQNVMRHLFKKKCEKEEEEKAKRSKLQALHENKCYYLKMDPATTPMFPEIPEYYFDPTVGTWYKMPELTPHIDAEYPFPRMATLPFEAFRETDPELPKPEYIYPPGIVKVSYLYGVPMSLDPEYCNQQPKPAEPEPEPKPPVITDDDLPRFYIDPETGAEVPIPEEQSPPQRPLPDSAPSFEDSKRLFSSNSSTIRNGSVIEFTTSDEPPSTHVLAEVVRSVAKADSSVVSRVASQTSSTDFVIKLPSNWRIARDVEGRAYYYNIDTKETQWDPPEESQMNAVDDAIEEITVVEMETASTDSETGDEDSDNGSDDDDDDDSDKEGGELDAKAEKGIYSDLGAQERNLLLKSSKRKSKEERQHERRQKRERDREKREYERKRRRERHGKHRRDGLVLEKLIPRRTDKTDMMSFDEIRDRLANRDAIRERQAIEEMAEEEQDREEERQRRLQADRLSRQEQESLSRPTTAAADTSSEVAKKIRDRFMKEVSKVIVKVLDPFRRQEVTKGHIKNNDDFKHLAKKLTNYILTKELKHCPRIEDLKCSDSVKKKAAEFVKKYMSKFNEGYKRSPSSAK